MSRILVTGVDGFTGIHLTRVLLERGYEVHGLVRSRARVPLDPAVRLHQCDLDDANRLAALVKEIGARKVVHLAAVSFVGHRDVDQIYRTNLLGTRHLLEALRLSSDGLDAVLLASSANVYGNSHSGAISETAERVPVNDYAVSKVAMEYLASLYRDNLPIIITRPFNYTGVGQEREFLVPKMVDHVKRRAPFIELGNINIERDWSDVRSVVDIYTRLLEARGAIGRTLNVCSGQARSLRQLLDLACQIGEHEIEVRVNPALVRQNEVRSLSGDKAMLESIIGPVISFPIMDTIGWMLASK